MKGSEEQFREVPQGESRVAARESKVKLPSYQGQDDTTLWGEIIREAGKLYRAYAAEGKNVPEDKIEDLRARVEKLEHQEAFRSVVGLSVWAGEIEKDGGITTYENLFGDNFTNKLEQARAISDFSGYKLPPFRERRQVRLSYSKALLEAHRAFAKKEKLIRGTKMSEVEREVFEAAQAADREATRFLWGSKDTEIYQVMVDDSLHGEVKGERETREAMFARAEAHQPKTETEEDRRAQVDELVGKKDRLWEEVRTKDKVGEARENLRTIIEISNRIKELRVAPLRASSVEKQVFASQEEIDERAADFMDKMDIMTPDEFAAGVLELKRYIPGKDTASIVGVLMRKAKAKREEAEVIQPPTQFSEGTSFRERIAALRQLLRKLFVEKKAVVLEDMAEAIEGGKKRIYERDEKTGKNKTSPAMQEVEEKILKARKRKRKIEMEQRKQREEGARSAKTHDRLFEVAE